MSHLMPNEVVFLIVFLVTILIGLIGFCFVFWYNELRKPKVKPRVAICAKCKYCVRTRWYQARIQSKLRCRAASDPTPINYITGKKAYPKFDCGLRNGHGTCVEYKKAWWR